MIYTEVDSHVASLRERRQVVRLLWAVSNEPDISLYARWYVRVSCLRYTLPWKRVSMYIVNRNADA